MAAVGPRRAALFVCRHGEREDYVWRARGENWQRQAARPWDSPMTPNGHLQAKALGESLSSKWYDALGVAPVTKVVVSPLLRCVETGAAIAEALGLASVYLEPRIVEMMCEEWYRSWSIPEADSTWGEHMMAIPVKEDELHPAARGPSSDCLPTVETIQGLRDQYSLSPLGRDVPVLPNTREPPIFEYKWGHYEGEEQQERRMRDAAEAELPAGGAEGGGGSVLLVSHGGPTGILFDSLTKTSPPYSGYCSLFAYVRSDREPGWEALLAANQDHLALVPEATRAGPNDQAEQKKVAVEHSR